MISDKTIAIVKATAPVVAEHSLAITKNFYPTMFSKFPAAKMFFNVANQRTDAQPKALANAVVAYASNIDNLGVLGDAVELMAVKHCGLYVLPEHYTMVEQSMALAIKQTLGDAVTEEVGDAWAEAVHALSEVLYTREEQLYKEAEARTGGWRGWREFKVDAIDKVADRTARLVMRPADGYKGTFDFTPGQFLSLKHRLDEGNPRHYTVTSAPGDDHLACCVRRVQPDGLVSSEVHDKLKVGDSIYLTAPFGVFTHSAPVEAPVVTISAGIGLTPIVAMLPQLAKHSSLRVLHQDCSPSSHAFADIMAKHDHVFRYDSEKESLTADDIRAAVTPETHVVMCGPPGFMQKVRPVLAEAGVKNVAWERFGPQLSGDSQ
jgi:nitric oxide dioxygenase